MAKPLAPKKYLFATALTVVLIAAAVGAFLFRLQRQGRLPPVPISGNICLDEKLEWLRARGSLACDVLAAGSSMTLNNLSSDRLVAQLPSNANYLNLGAWGMKMSDTAEVIDYALRVNRPRLVVVVCGPMDFYRGPPLHLVKPRDYAEVLGGTWYPLLVAQHLDLSYYLRRSANLGELRRKRSDYDSLQFDECGGIGLEIDEAHINTVRWHEHVRPELFDERHYRALSDLAEHLHREGIGLVCAQAPLRTDSIGEAMSALERHWQRIDGIMRANGFRFINCHGRVQVDNGEFADYSHLNRTGADAFTDEFMRESAAIVGAALERSSVATR